MPLDVIGIVKLKSIIVTNRSRVLQGGKPIAMSVEATFVVAILQAPVLTWSGNLVAIVVGDSPRAIHDSVWPFDFRRAAPYA